MNKSSQNEEVSMVVRDAGAISDFVVVQQNKLWPQKEADFTSPLCEGGCIPHSICLPSHANRSSCICLDGYKLSQDKMSCEAENEEHEVKDVQM